MENTFYYKSQIGILEIVLDEDFVVSLRIVETLVENPKETIVYQNIKTQLGEYFSGKRKSFDIKIKPNGTEFQRLVWKELRKIPYGETKSYGEIADNIGKKGAARAVGMACNKNPILLFIPCHRVIGKNGNLTGFAGGIKVKEKLLEIEQP